MRNHVPGLDSIFCHLDLVPQGEPIHQIVCIDVIRHRVQERQDIVFLPHHAPGANAHERCHKTWA